MTVQDSFHLWQKKAVEDPDLVRELAAMAGDENAIYEAFYTDLKFGTAGLRGILGPGSNRMNIYVVRRATQGLAEYVKTTAVTPAVAIAYDSRRKSKCFAMEAASVFAANGVKAYLYQELMPTPMLSWAVRQLGCASGIVITASHNPAEYNGYKAYGNDGCQLNEDASEAVLQRILAIDPFEGVRSIPFAEGLAAGSIAYIPNTIIEGFYQRVLACSLRQDLIATSDLAVAYTPLCGAGNLPVRNVLAKAGLKKLYIVEAQEQPDENFTSCSYPNPETKEALALGLALAEEKTADILIATDPDADRVGVAVLHQGAMHRLTGNEVGVLLVDYIAQTRIALNKMPAHAIMVKSIVSTPLSDLVAAQYGVSMQSVLTGFKNIGEAIAQLEEKGEADRFIFAYEESCGYLPGDYVRDKDAVAACLLIVEMAAWHKRHGRTLLDVLEDIAQQHGFFCERVTNTAFPGAQGMNEMASLMDNLFQNPPTHLGETEVILYSDLRHQVTVQGNQRRPSGLPPSDVLMIKTQNGADVIIRPSGTEPKLKVYYMCRGTTPQQAEESCELLMQAISQQLSIS